MNLLDHINRPDDLISCEHDTFPMWLQILQVAGYTMMLALMGFMALLILVAYGAA